MTLRIFGREIGRREEQEVEKEKPPTGADWSKKQTAFGRQRASVENLKRAAERTTSPEIKKKLKEAKEKLESLVREIEEMKDAFTTGLPVSKIRETREEDISQARQEAKKAFEKNEK